MTERIITDSNGRKHITTEPLLHPPQRTEPVSDDIASILACRDMLDAQPVPPRSTEQNFCPRCGKRTKDMTHIHTCTPPKD